jgi:multidrug efflux system membrane fusion protein
VRARVSGQITRVHFKEGQDVAEGDLLFSIDPRPFEAALRQAEANLRKDEVQAANAEVEARRYEALVAEGVASREDAQARRANAAALAAVVQADRAAVASSKLELGYTTVRAPMDGRTGSVRAREGSVIQADTTELVVINKIRPAFVGFTVPEQSLGEIQRYMAAGPLPIAAAPPNVQGPPEQGVLTFVDNAVDRATGTILLRGTFANESLRLWPGQFVQATVVLTRMPDAVVVPGAAIQSSQSGTYVFVIQPDLTAQMRPVEVGTQVDGGAVVVARGLSAGERVVTDGQLRLVPGAKVAIQERPAGPEDAGAEGGP